MADIRKSKYVAAAALFVVMPVVQLADHQKSDMLEHRTPVAMVAPASVSSTASFAMSTPVAGNLVQNAILGDWHGARPLDFAVTNIIAPKAPGKQDN